MTAIVMCSVLGLLIGSFLNVVILRLPPLLQWTWRSQCHEYLELPFDEARPAGLILEPSRCCACQHPIAPWFNIPLLSYLWLRGRCAYCQQPFGSRYPLIEALTSVLFIAVAWHFQTPAALTGALILTSLFIALAIIDFEHMLLPDAITLPGMWAGLLFSLIDGSWITPEQSIIGAIAGYMSLWMLYHGYKLLKNSEGMGMGDLKLAAMIGAWLGYASLPLALILASISGIAFALARAVTGHGAIRAAIPFGPFLAAGGWLTLIWGDWLLSGYWI